jgi:serine/threonine protein kinase
MMKPEAIVTPILSCPPEQTLRRFLLGQVIPEEAESLEVHLNACEPCVATLSTLHADDSLVEAMRCRNSIAEQPASEGDRLLAEWLKTLRPDSVPGSRPPAATPSGDSPTAEFVRAEQGGETGIYDFLAPSSDPHELGRLGHYEVRKVLDSGGMGVVFEAYDPILQRLVALKAMLPALAKNPSAKQRFLREARAAAAIKHDHIVTIYHVGEDNGVAYFAMELLEGESLEQRLRREPRLPAEELLRIGRESAQGLAAAHKHHLIHRDIKPSNIWLETRAEEPESAEPASPSRPSRVKILDFGLVSSTADKASLTQPGAILGTPAFMAPEQFRDQSVDARSDLFSLGCVFYRMATGEVPFRGAHSISTLIAIATTAPRPPREIAPDLPQAVDDLILRLLAKEPADRPASAAAVIEAIRAIEQDRARPAAPVRRPRRPLGRAVLGLAAACVFGLLCYGTWSAVRSPGPQKDGGPGTPDDTSSTAISGVGKRPPQFYADPARGLEGVLDHREIAGADADKFREWRASLGRDFRLAHLSTRKGPGPVLFNAVAVREQTPRLVRFSPDVPDALGPKNFGMLSDDGFRLLSLGIHTTTYPKAAWAESQIWIKDDTGYNVDGGTFAELTARIRQKRAKGSRPVGLETFPTPDGVRFTSNFAEVRDRLWEVDHPLDADALWASVKAYKDRGWRPDILTPYWDKGRFRFILVAVGNDDGPDWRFRMEMTLGQYQKESAEQRDGGLFPLVIASYGNDADVRYAAVWVRHRAPGAEPPPSAEPDTAALASKTVSWSSDTSAALYNDKARALEEVVDFREVYGKTSDELRDWHKNLDPKFRMGLVTSRRGAGPPLFNAVAVQERKQTVSRFHLEVPEDSTKQVWDKNREDGFRLITARANLDEDHQFPWNSTQIWVNDGVGQWFWHGWMPNITGGNKEGRREGGRPIAMDGTMSPTGLGCSTTLGADQGRAWEVFYSLTDEELLTAIDFYRRKGWRPDVLVPYKEDDQQRHMLVVVDNSDRVDWRFRMGMSEGVCRKESARQKRDGLFPLGLVSYGNDEAVRYAAIFVRYRKPSTK